MELFAQFDPILKVRENYSLKIQAHHPEDSGIPLLKPFSPLLKKLLGIKSLETICHRVHNDKRDINLFEKILDAFELKIDASNLPSIPKTGPLVVVANHPLAGIDSVAIAAAISRVRPDVGIYLNSMLAEIPDLQSENFIFVNVFKTNRTSKSVISSLRKSHKWLSDNKVLVIHPSGAVSDLNNSDGRVLDPPWTLGAWKLAEKYGAPILPIFVHGHLSGRFLRLRKLSVNASVALLIPEMIKLKGTTVKLDLKHLVYPGEDSAELGTDRLREIVTKVRPYFVTGNVSGLL